MGSTLVIDTSFGSTVGIVGHEPLVESDSRMHVERLQVNISTVVKQAGLQTGDISRIVVGLGPAPFTGLRVGVVAAKALAFATGAQLLEQDVLTPQAVMMAIRLGSVPHSDQEDDSESESIVPRHLTLAVNDARRKQLYFSLFDNEAYDSFFFGDRARLIPMDIDYPHNTTLRIKQVLNHLHDVQGRHCIVDVVGHGAKTYEQEWQLLGSSLGTVVNASVLDDGVAGLSLFAQCALAQENRRQAIDPLPSQSQPPVEPLYLRRPDVSVPKPLKHVLDNMHGHRPR